MLNTQFFRLVATGETLEGSHDGGIKGSLLIEALIDRQNGQ